MNDTFKGNSDLKLYHASAERRDIIQPRQNITLSGEEGNFVFASDRWDMAVACLALTSSNVLAIGDFSDHTPRIFVRDWKDYLSTFEGGYIHEVPTDKFRNVKQSGMKTSEWVSTEAIQPVSAVHIINPAHALRLGVQIYSVASEYSTPRFALDWDEGYITPNAIESDYRIKCETPRLCQHFGLKTPEA